MVPGVKVSPARELATHVVSRVTTDGAWAPSVLDNALRSSGLSDRDRAFATRLAYGTVELLPTVDALIRALADRPGRIRPRVMNALRVATYELLTMSTPTAVAVDQGVELVRKADRHAAGFANALLRKVADRAQGFPWGDSEHDILALACETGFPEPIVDLLVAEVGEPGARRLIEGSRGPAPLYVAVDPFITTVDAALDRLAQLGADPLLTDVPGCIECRVASLVMHGGADESSGLIVCDAAPQAIVSALPIAADSHIVDIGAGRGTKTALLRAAAERAGVSAQVSAIDSHQWKVSVLEQRMSALSVPDVEAYVADATDAGALGAAIRGQADAVFVDAPCSGLGTLRRHPEKRWRLDPEGIEGLAALGLLLARASASLVRPGGFMMYSTCTVLPAENDHVIEEFLGSPDGAGFTVADLGPRLPESMRRFVTAEGYLQSWPEAGGPDGHFAALLARRA